MNKWFGAGRLVRDVEVKTTTSGKSVMDNAVACKRMNDEADFINIEAWGATAETMGKWLGKGSEVVIVGEIRSKTYEDKNGNKRTDTYVLVDRCEFVGGKRTEAPKNDGEFSDDFAQNFWDDELPY